MTPIYQQILAGSTAGTLYAQSFDMTALGINCCLEVIVESAATNLVGEVIFRLGNEVPGGIVQNGFVQTTVLPTGLSVVANPGTNIGHVRIGQVPLVQARSTVILRSSSAYANWITPTFIYTSGGDAASLVRVIAWGAQFGQQ